MLVRVSLDEIAAHPQLEFRLYQGNGDVFAEVGTPLHEKTLKHAKRLALYRNPAEMPINHEGRLYYFPQESASAHPLQDEALENESLAPAIFQPETNDFLLQSTHYFFQKLATGHTTDVALAEVIRDKLVAEITTQVDQVRYLSQMRVRDKVTYSHTLNVAAVSIALAHKLGYDFETVRDIGLAAMLHDLGKLLIPKPIMFKTSRLTEKEFEVMKLHPEFGYKIITQHLRLHDDLARPALEHQEMYGGGGYPLGLKGNEIHVYSQIVKIADVYDALTAVRPYKGAIAFHKALDIMRSEGDKSFNPEFLKAFFELSNYQPGVHQDSPAPVLS